MPVIGTPISGGSGETTLQGLRRLVVEKTGIYHLVGTQASGGDTVPDYASDNGIDFYINKAIKWLDEQVMRKRRKDVSLSAGAYTITLDSSLMAIDYVDLDDQDDALTPVSENWLKETFGYDFNTAKTGTPLYWAEHSDRDSGSTNKALWLLPVTEEDTVVQIHGRYYETALVNNSDTNWWTLRHAEKVVYVAILLINEMDLNASPNNTLVRLIEEVRRALITQDIMNEVSVFGDVMRG